MIKVGTSGPVPGSLLSPEGIAALNKFANPVSNSAPMRSPLPFSLGSRAMQFGYGNPYSQPKLGAQLPSSTKTAPAGNKFPMEAVRQQRLRQQGISGEGSDSFLQTFDALNIDNKITEEEKNILERELQNLILGGKLNKTASDYFYQNLRDPLKTSSGVSF